MMAAENNPSQLLQIPGATNTVTTGNTRSLSSRTLQAVSTAWSNPDFVITGGDSRLALSQPTSPTPSGLLATRPPSPCPPRFPAKRKSVAEYAQAKKKAKKPSTARKVRQSQLPDQSLYWCYMSLMLCGEFQLPS